MKWFDAQGIKQKDSLTAEQIKYLERPSITIFGPFNVLVRKQWDLLFSWIGISILNAIVEASSDELLTYVIAFVLFGLSIWLIYFGVRHGRRLAWNRNNWKSFEDFQKSESSWAPWGWIFASLGALVSIGSFLEGYLGIDY